MVFRARQQPIDDALIGWRVAANAGGTACFDAFDVELLTRLDVVALRNSAGRTT